MCLIVFTTTIDTMLFFASFSEIPMRYLSNIRCWKPEQGTPTEPTGSPVDQKIHLDEIHAGFVPQLAKKNTVPFKLKVTVLPYCTVWLMVNYDSQSTPCIR